MNSLRSRLTIAVMMPMVVLATIFGGLTCWMMHRTISTASDQMLVRSVSSIGHVLDTGGSADVALLPLAVSLIRRRTSDPPLYSVYDGTTLLVGTRRLLPPADYRPTGSRMAWHEPASFAREFRVDMADPTDPTSRRLIQPAYLRDDEIDGRPVRIATEIRILHRGKEPVAIQVAEFLDDRSAYEQIYYLRVVSASILIVMLAVLLFYGAITWGLGPFASLTAQINAARGSVAPDIRVALAEDDPLEARLLANAFNELMERTQRASRSLRQFTANASHQLRTPLAIIRVHAEVVERFGPATPQGAAALADISAAVTSLERLLSQLIALARTDEGLPVQSEAFELSALAADVLAERVAQPDAAQMDIGFEKGEGALVVSGERTLAAELLGNLLDNAIRYNQPDGAVTLRAFAADGIPRIEIEDDGPGIPAEHREKIWDRFYRATGQDGPPGSGLGLPIVRALADRIGAEVTLHEGTDGRGTLASVTFAIPPLQNEDDDEAQSGELAEDFRVGAG